MLGFDDQKTTIVKEPFSTELIKKLIRFRKGEYTEKELLNFKRQKKIMKIYRAIWKDE